ncbi:hypothetical protein J6590_058790 [Homalodisca vitripennis]|nr:hypothetical protein J6590_058790 [Homalodisca vitripennis]
MLLGTLIMNCHPYFVSQSDRECGDTLENCDSLECELALTDVAGNAYKLQESVVSRGRQLEVLRDKEHDIHKCPRLGSDTTLYVIKERLQTAGVCCVAWTAIRGLER